MTAERTTIAIDFGSTKIVTAYLNNNDRATILIDAQTNRTMLNAIQFTENQCLVGNGADYGADVNARNTISGIDLKLLLTNNDLDGFSLMRTETMPFPAFWVDYQKHEERLHLVQLIALLLAKVKENAEDSLETEVKHCNITVPTCYTPQQRLMMQDAGKMVGFEEVQTVDDTTAAALTYAFDKKNIEDPHKILIFDIGATSTEAAIFLVENFSITVQACKGEMNLGGKNFDACLMKHFGDQFKEKTEVDLTGKQYELSTLRSNCEELKKRLASVETAKVTIQLFHNGQPYDLQLTRTEFEDICDDIFTRIMNVFKAVLDQTNKSDIKKVILIGGGSRLPKIQKEIVSLMEDKELSRILNQDEATATGAAYYTLKKIDIKKLTGHDNDHDSKSVLNLEDLHKFLLKVQNNNKAFVEYNSERVNLEALCYRFKRELKNRNLDEVESKTILDKCNETLLWIKQSNYNNPTTTQMVKENAVELTKVNTNVASQPEKKELARVSSYDSSQPEKEQTVKEKVPQLVSVKSYDSNQQEKVESDNKVVDLVKVYSNDDSDQPRKTETVKEPTKVDSYISNRQEDMEISYNEEPTTNMQQNKVAVPVRSPKSQNIGWNEQMLIEGDRVERNINQEKQVEPMDTSPEKAVENNLSLVRKMFQQGLTFYNNEQYIEASTVFTEVLNSKDVKDINLEICLENRASCYYRMEQFQRCIDDLIQINKTARLQDKLNEAEHCLYQEKAVFALKSCNTKGEKGDIMSQVSALSLLTEALTYEPQNASISNIRYTSQLLHLKAMYNFALGNYSDAIWDIYRNMLLIEEHPDLSSQKHDMCKEVFEKITTIKKAAKKNVNCKHLQVQLSYIEKCLKHYGYSSGWLTNLFLNTSFDLYLNKCRSFFI